MSLPPPDSLGDLFFSEALPEWLKDVPCVEGTVSKI